MGFDVRCLDSDMQLLVYENYNKFLSATETIRSMKANVEGMDSGMAELRAMIGAGPCVHALCASHLSKSQLKQ